MGRIHGERRQDGKELLVEELVEKALVLGVEVVPVRKPDAGRSEIRDQPRREGDVAFRSELLDALVDLVQPVPNGLVVGAARGNPCLEPHLEASDPDLEELVEVVAEDREELGPFEHGRGASVRDAEDALVEVEPRRLAIEEAA